MHTAPKLGPVDFRRSFGGTIATYRPSTTCYGGRCLVREPGGVALGQATDWLRGRGLSAVSRRGRCRRYIRHGLPWREPTTASFAAGYAKERAQTSGRAAQRRSRPPTYCPNSSWQRPVVEVAQFAVDGRGVEAVAGEVADNRAREGEADHAMQR